MAKKVSKTKQEQYEELLEKQYFKDRQVEEALKRMELLNMSSKCIEAFKDGNVWESEGIGALYECNKKEKSIIKEFEEKFNGKVYHMIHDMFEFGECYSMLYVSNEKSEWKQDIEDLKEGIAFAYVKNLDDDLCSEFGTIGIKPNIGGIRRIS